MLSSSSKVVPVVIALTLCGVSAGLLYVLLRKDDDDEESKRDEATSNFVKRTKAVPKDAVVAIIGRGGRKIKEISSISGASLNMDDRNDELEERQCIIQGSLAAVTIAEKLVDEIVEQQKLIETSSLSVPYWAVGKIIGRGGENVNAVSQNSGAKIKIEDSNVSFDSASHRNITITGLPLQIKMATEMIEKCIEESKQRKGGDMKKREPRGKPLSPKSPEDSALQVDPGTKGLYPQNAPPAGSSGALLEVFVSAISSPSRFWMQLVGPQVEELDRLVDTMTEYYSNSENRNLHKLSDVQIGQIVAAVFRHDGKWYRAKVLDIKPNEFDERQQVCDLYFVDYGDNEYVAKNELYSLRTDMLKLRFQAVECFLAGVTPAAPKDSENVHASSWDNLAIERFEDLTQVARWRPLWSKTCTFKERPKIETNTLRNSREGSPIPGVKLYDTKEGKEIDIGQVLIEEGWALEATDQEQLPVLPALPKTPTTPTLPPTFGDLECSRVLGMVIGAREERASSLPHGGTSPGRNSPNIPSTNIDDAKPKSLSLAAGMNENTTKNASATHPPPSELSNPKAETNGFHLNGSLNPGSNAHHNGDFINAEREGNSREHAQHLPRATDGVPKPHPIHVPGPKDDLKAKINRVESHHGNLEALGKLNPPTGVVNPPKNV